MKRTAPESEREQRPAATSQRQARQGPSNDRPGPAGRIQRKLGNGAVQALAERGGSDASESRRGPRDGGDAVAEVTAESGRRVPYRREMESAFGAEFGDVTAHVGRSARVACRELGARAFARGTHVAFASGSPDREVVAHELAHVQQQRDAGSPTVAGRTAGVPTSDAETQAAAAAAEATARGRVSDDLRASLAGTSAEERVARLPPGGQAVAVDGAGGRHPEELPWSTRLETSVGTARSRFGPGEVAEVRTELDAELETFTETSRELFERFNEWAEGESEELLAEFEQEMPNLAGAVVGTVAWETVGTMAGRHPGTDVAWKVFGFALGRMKKRQEVEETNAQVRRNTEEAQAVFQALDRLQGSSLEAIIESVSRWVGACENALGRVEANRTDLEDFEERIDRLQQRERNDGDVGESVDHLRSDLREEVDEMAYHMRLARAAVAGLGLARSVVERRGNRALEDLRGIFDAWQTQRRHYESFDRDAATRHFYWHPETGQVAELTGDRVNPDPVLVASSPRGFGDRAETVDEPEDGRDARRVEQAEDAPVDWGRNFNNNLPIHGEVDTSSGYVRLYAYTGLWPDGMFHVMTKVGSAPYQAKIEDGRIVSWDFDESDHPAFRALFGRFPTANDRIARATGMR